MTPGFFDSHGGLPPGPLAAGVAGYAAALAAAGASEACIQALPGHAPEAFCRALQNHPGWLPIPAWPSADAPVAAELDRFRRLGAVGLHLHPRACGVSPDSPLLGEILQGAAARDLVVFFCSYGFAPAAQRLPPDPLPGLSAAMAGAPGLRLVLLHGGGVDLLHHAEFVRANPGTLLDLSFTLMKYAGSSIDLDIGFLCRSFDQRLCLGSDFPDYTPAAVLARLQQLCPELPPAKLQNILGSNLRRLLRRGGPADGA